MRIGLGLHLTDMMYASGVTPPPVPASWLAYYEASLDNGNPVNYGSVSSWGDQSPSNYDLTQGTAGNRPAYRSFAPAAIYGLADDFISIGSASIDKRSFSFFALADVSRYTSKLTETFVLFTFSGGTLQVVVTAVPGNPARLVWVDAGGTRTSSIPVPSSLSLIGVTCSASAVTVWVNDVSEAFAANTAGTISSGYSLLGSGTNGWSAGVVAAVLYNVALSTPNKTLLDAWAVSRGARYPSQLSKVLVANGDSIADHDNSEDLLGFVAQSNYSGAVLYQAAYPANTWDDVTNNRASVDALYSTSKRCVMWLNCGVNNINTLGETDAAVLTKAQANLAYFREVGYQIICNQIADAGVLDPTEQGYRAAYNVSLTASSARQYANTVLAVPTELQDDTNLTYFDADTIHWKHAGHAAMAAAGQSALTSLLNQPVTSLKLRCDLNGDLLDSTVYTRDFTAINSPTYTTGLNGKQCLVTATTGGRYARYRAAGLHCLKFYPLTVMMWLRTSSTTYNGMLLGNSAYTGLAFLLHEATGRFRAYLAAAGGASVSAVSSLVVNDNVWHVVAASFDATGVKVYTSTDSNAANLSLTGSAAWSGTPGPHNSTGDYLNFGCDNNAGTGVENGNFQGLRIWSEARSLAQLQAETP